MWTVLVVLVVLAAGCGGGDGGTSYADAAALTDRLGCQFEAEEPGGALFGPTPLETGTCDLDGQEVTVEIYGSADHARQAVRQAETIGCTFAEGFGIDQFNFAIGENWMVVPADNLDADTAEEVADTLGGFAATVDC